MIKNQREKKIFVSYERESAWNYYLLMRAWQQADGTPFPFVDMIYGAPLQNTREEYERRLLSVLEDCNVFLLLLGDRTKFSDRVIKCELRAAIGEALPIIVVNLNGSRERDALRVPSELSSYLSVHIGFAPQILQHALANWPGFVQEKQNAGETGFYYYSSEVYRGLGL